MAKDSTAYTLGFAAAVCVACSVMVSGAATLLKARQTANIRLDIQKNILVSVGRLHAGEKRGADEVGAMYAQLIEERVVDSNGKVVEGRKPSELDPKKDKDLHPLYLCVADGKLEAYAFPVSGKGLWSTLYGYLALEPDGVTVKGLTFYQHGETPGLGGEIEKPAFLDDFKGEKILDSKRALVSVRVAKGKSDPSDPHAVDGISGATLTGDGVTDLLKAGVERYDPYFKTVRKKR